MTDIPDELRAFLEHVVDVDCRSALYDQASTESALLEILDHELGERPPALLDALRARVRQATAAHAREEATWRERTDNDRLDAALAELQARGVVTAQALGFTLQEGAAMIDQAVLARGPSVRGSVFFHRQDLERALAGEGLSLAFTAYVDDGGATSVALGHEIVALLARHGLHAEWNGTREKRPRITPFVWRRRRATVAPAEPGPAPAVPTVVAAPAPPQQSAPCARCGGRGWIQASPEKFPETCECRTVSRA